MSKLPPALLLLTILVAVVQLVVHYQWLPERVASHFDFAGQPDGFMSKAGFVSTMLALTLGMPMLFTGLSWLSRFLPPSMINIPHREYWLHPERREATQKALGNILIWIAIITEVFLIVLNQLTFQANRSGAGLSPVGSGLAMAVFLLAMVLVCALTWRRFSLPANE